MRRKVQQIKTKIKLYATAGFTLIELLIVIAIISLLATIILTAVGRARSSAKQTTAFATVKQLETALALYNLDIGSYPPDVTRGWDPGLVKALPYDTSGGSGDCNTTPGSCTCGVYIDCTGYTPPANWIATTSSTWRGPYVAKWPTATPWGGTYDYNYWPTPTVRNGCTVPAGIYLGIESSAGFTLDSAVEQSLYNAGIDNDGCSNNGEVQILLVH